MAVLPQDGKLIKVTFEYADGSKHSLTKKNLEMWQNFNLNIASWASFHNMNPPWEKIKWKKQK